MMRMILVAAVCGLAVSCVHTEVAHEENGDAGSADAGELNDAIEVDEAVAQLAVLFAPERTDDADRWSWPTAEMFAQVMAQRASAAPIRLVLGAVHFKPAKAQSDACAQWSEEAFDDVVVGVTQRGQETQLLAVFAPERNDWSRVDRRLRQSSYEVVTGLDAASASAPPTYATACGVVSLVPSHVTPSGGAKDPYWSDWVYATTLMTFGSPLYDESEANGELSWEESESLQDELREATPARRVEIARDLLSTDVSSNDHIWAAVLPALIEAGEDDLAHDVYRRFRPYGRCSMDDYPAVLAGQYATFCARRGDLGCYIQLQTRILGNHFNRVAWSSMGERAYQPSARALFEAPVNGARFLRGALLRYTVSSERPELGAWRLARAIGNAGLTEVIDDLAKVAADPELDELNRLLAAQVLYFVSDQDYGKLSHDAAAAIGALESSPITSFWLQAQASN